MKKIKKIAYKLDGKTYSLPLPSSHHEVREKNGLMNNGRRGERGFLDETGLFIDRKTAARIATKAGQVKQSDDLLQKGRLHSHHLRKKDA